MLLNVQSADTEVEWMSEQQFRKIIKKFKKNIYLAKENTVRRMESRLEPLKMKNLQWSYTEPNEILCDVSKSFMRTLGWFIYI